MGEVAEAEVLGELTCCGRTMRVIGARLEEAAVRVAIGGGVEGGGGA